MNSLETLKQELITQKNLIDSKGGNVIVAGNNPTPSEITAGINSLETPDYASTNATVEDVVAGKTFISGNSTIKTGTLNYSSDSLRASLLWEKTATNGTFSFSIPSGTAYVRPYAFYSNMNTVDIYFSSTITEIGSYAFYSCSNFKFPNFNSLQNITTIADHAFERGNRVNSQIDYSALPSSITKIATYGFYNMLPSGTSVALPALTSLGTFAFGVDNDLRTMGSLTYAQGFSLTTLPISCFQQCRFGNHFRIPTGVTTVGNDFNYRGNFASVTVPSSVTRLGHYCFGSYDFDANSLYTTSYFLFEGTTPPTMGNDPIAKQNLNHNFKIYVPDNAVDTYKNHSGFATYANVICSVEEMEWLISSLFFVPKIITEFWALNLSSLKSSFLSSVFETYFSR